MSAIESAANLVLGYIISVLLLYTIMPLYGYYPDFSTSNQMVLWFTVASFLRSYGLRRLFNSMVSIKLNNTNNDISSNKDIDLIRFQKELDRVIITISLKIKEKRSLAFFFLDRVREVFGTKYEVELVEDNKIVIFINNSAYSDQEYFDHKVKQYQLLINTVLNGGYNSYEELMIKSFDLNLSPK